LFGFYWFIYMQHIEDCAPRSWSTLSRKEKKSIRKEAQELFSYRPKTMEKAEASAALEECAKWLRQEKNVVNPSVRDLFR